MILLIDSGSQYTALISYILTYDLNIPFTEILFEEISLEYLNLKKYKTNIKGVIISGGPKSAINTDQNKKLKVDWLEALISNKIPIFGICFGLQWIISVYGGKISKSEIGEYGKAEMQIDQNISSVLLKNVSDKSVIWMSHSDKATKIPQHFVSVASTKNCTYTVVENQKDNIYLTQFHPEVKQSTHGTVIIQNFLNRCGYNTGYQEKNNDSGNKINGQKIPNGFNYVELAEKLIEEIRTKVGDQRVLLGVSGGVDSTILSHLFARAIPGRLHCVFINNGLMRKNEVREICDYFKDIKDINFILIDAVDYFFEKLRGLSDPEDKRKAIGHAFIDKFEERVTALIPRPTFFAQGTIFPDVIESKGLKNGGSLIKSHHNVGGLPEKLNMNLIEPFRNLFKNQVRSLGSYFSVKHENIVRHPFPGPGLALRVVGECTPQLVDIVREADDIFITMLKRKGIYEEVSQAYTALLPSKAVGVVGDNRRYGFCIVLRAVISEDFMTASIYNFDNEFLGKVSREIIGKIHQVARVLYDITSKPPGTIEME